MEVPTIPRRRFIPQRKDTGKSLRTNDYIKKSPIRLIGEENEQIGVIDLEDAKARARDAGLDLVEVAPNSDPPVCRIMDYGKWKYAQRKKEQKAKAHSKQSELKEVRLRPKIDKHDLEIKMGKAREFLEDGHKVQFTMLFRGREMVHRDLGIAAMKRIADDLDALSKVETFPRMMGRRMTMMLAPEKKSAEKVAAKEREAKAAAQSSEARSAADRASGEAAASE